MKYKEIFNEQNGYTTRRYKNKTAVGTSIGILAEAAAGFLLAPRPSREIRKNIRREAEWNAQQAREAAQGSRIR